MGFVEQMQPRWIRTFPLGLRAKVGLFTQHGDIFFKNFEKLHKQSLINFEKCQNTDQPSKAWEKFFLFNLLDLWLCARVGMRPKWA